MRLMSNTKISAVHRSILFGEEADKLLELSGSGKPITGYPVDFEPELLGGFNLPPIELPVGKRYNTADYEYLRQLEENRRRKELLLRIEFEKELKDFRKAKLKLVAQKDKEKPPMVESIPVIPDTLKSLVRKKVGKRINSGD